MGSSATRLRIDTAKARFSRCDSKKIGYATRAEAFDAAEILMQEGHVHAGCHITPYACDECGQWHVFNRVIIWGASGR
jgi:hypothetical protein